MKRHLKDYFIPHGGNDYKPHSLQKVALVGMTTLVFISFAVANLHSLLWINSQWLVSTILPAVIVDLTNDERVDDTLGSLRRNTTLDAAARLKAEHMAANEYFSHFAPDGTSPWHWFAEIGYNFVHAGENLAIHFSDSDEVVEAWMNSPTHRANILNGDYQEIGVGTAKGMYQGFETVYVVQLFGTQPAANPTPVVAGEAEELPLVPEPPVEVVAIPEPPAEAPTVAPVNDAVLAEAVELTETIEVLPTEPVLVVADELVIEPVAIAESVSSTPISSRADSGEISSSTVVYSGFTSTSTGGVPATLADETLTPTQAGYTAPVSALATKPQTILQALYVLIGLFVIGSLLMAILIELRRQHPIQIAYSVALLLLMYGLFELHVLVSDGAVVV